MTHANSAINPFYSRRISRDATRNDACDRPVNRHVFVRLPKPPRNASPVPHLTSLYHHNDGSQYGDRTWPGNCGGGIIRDVLRFFQPGMVFDPMSGSGTCREVCEELGIPCFAFDIHQGFDACNAHEFPAAGSFDFIWAHPPYWRIKLYADDPRDLSRASTLDEFLLRYGRFIRNCANALTPGGKLAILMGDVCDREAGFIPLTFHTKWLAQSAGLRQCCTDIVRFMHGATSSRKVYRTSFIPILHDTCMIFERAEAGRRA